MIQSARNPVEGGSIVLRLSFKDTNGIAYEPLPDSVFFTLYAQRKGLGAWDIVNGHEDRPLSSASVVEIVLQGNDLALLPDCTTKRRIIVDWKYLYNSEETIGREMVDFDITPLPVLAE